MLETGTSGLMSGEGERVGYLSVRSRAPPRLYGGHLMPLIDCGSCRRMRTRMVVHHLFVSADSEHHERAHGVVLAHFAHYLQAVERG